MKKILFIDDELLEIEPYKTLLEMEGFLVEVIENPEEALTIITEKIDSYDLLILDIMMKCGKYDLKETRYGRRTGLKVLEEIRNITAKLPIIILTVVEDPILKKEAERFGINFYLLKPVKPSVLLDSINKL